MNQKLKLLEQEAKSAIQAVSTISKLNEVKSLYMGKKSPLQGIMNTIKDLSNDQKKEVGMEINRFKVMIAEEVAIKAKEIEELIVKRRLETEEIDVTLSGTVFSKGTIHPLMAITEEIEDIFIGMGYQIAEGPEIELDIYNFEMLNLPKGHPAREMHDSFYINPNVLLRTHTSPVQVRTMLEAKGKPLKIICPGRVYRRDNDDATHSHQFMQIEGLVVGTVITMADLKGTLSELVKKMFGDNRVIRFRPSFFPFTEPSVEVDVTCFKCNGQGCSLCKGSGWIEILGAGMVHPNVLKMAGYDPDIYQGFAFGLGIERVAMLRYEIDDIRAFYTNDIRFLKQF